MSGRLNTRSGAARIIGALAGAVLIVTGISVANAGAAKTKHATVPSFASGNRAQVPGFQRPSVTVIPKRSRTHKAKPNVAQTVTTTPAIAPLSTASKTFTVDTFTDTNPTTPTTACKAGNANTCSLRAAIGAANKSTGAVDVVNVPQGTYTLTTTTTTFGSLTIDRSIHIVGTMTNPTKVVISGKHQITPLLITATYGTPKIIPRVLIEGTKWTAGLSSTTTQGGDINVTTGDLVLSHDIITTGSAIAGGDVLVTGQGANLWASEVTFETGVAKPTTFGDGGDLEIQTNATASLTNDVFAGGIAYGGGAIYNHGTLSSDHNTFERNTAQLGGAVYNYFQYSDSGSTYLDDLAGGTGLHAAGGAVFNLKHASISTSTFRTCGGNTSTYLEGGVFYNDNGLTLQSDSVANTHNYAVAFAYGGVIANTYTYTTTGRWDHTRPDLKITTLTVKTTFTTTSFQHFVSGGVIYDAAEATITQLTILNTYNQTTTPAYGTNDTIYGGAIEDANQKYTGTMYPADLTIHDFSITATHDTTHTADVAGGAIGLGPTTHTGTTPLTNTLTHSNAEAATVSLTGGTVLNTTVKVGHGSVWGGAVDEGTNGSLSSLYISGTQVYSTDSVIRGGALYSTGHLSATKIDVFETTVTDPGSTGRVLGGVWFETTTITGTSIEIFGATIAAGKGVEGGGLLVNDAATFNALSVLEVHVEMKHDSKNIFGGAVEFAGKTDIMTNSTVAGNSATGTTLTHTSSILVATPVTFVNDTFVDDSAISRVSTSVVRPTYASDTGGLVVVGRAVASVENTIIDTQATNRMPNNCYLTTFKYGAQTPTPQINSIGGNIDTGNSCGLDQNSDQSTTTPMVGTLGTHDPNSHYLALTTIAIEATSPAIGHGVSAGAPLKDEYQVSRTTGGITVGALQYQATSNTTTTGGTTTHGGTTPGYVEVGAQGAWFHYNGGHLVASSPSPTALISPAVVAAASYETGLIETAANGYINIKGAGETCGNAAALHLNAPIVGIATSTMTGDGYWLVASDGGVFAYGSAQFFGSMGGQHLNAPIVGMAVTSTGEGYWLVASDGGVFAFGSAHTLFFGSMGGQHLNAAVVGMAPAPTDEGYWLVASDGGVFGFGVAHTQFFGSMGGQHLNAPIVGIVPTYTGEGYWLAGSDGGAFAFGAAHYEGSVSQGMTYAPTVAIVAGSQR